MSTAATLKDIRLKVRRVTARPSPNQISDAEIDDYVNNFYIYDLPEHLRLFNLKTDYTINITFGEDRYAFDRNTYLSVQAPLYIAGYESQYYQDKQTFYQFYPMIQTPQNLTVGTGVVGPYSGTIAALPIIKRSVYITALDGSGTTLHCEDDGSGNLVGDVTSGTVDYYTGWVSNLVWISPIPSGNIINEQSVASEFARPQAVLFYEDYFWVRPVPDGGYQMKMTAFIKPTELLAGSDKPILEEWWQLLAYGAALKIFEDNLDMESYQKVYTLFDQHMRLVERRTLKQLSTQRANTIYSQYDQYPYSGMYPFM